MSRKIKWGIIGLGKIARQFASDMALVPNGELVAVASRSQEKAVTFGQEFGAELLYASYDELIASSEVEAIYIATPHNLHFELAKQCLENDKAVLCEKPITTSPEQLEVLMAIQEKTNNYLMEGMWSYFLPVIHKVDEWIGQGKIGRIIHLKANFGFPPEYNPESRLFNPDLAGGSVFDVGIYPIAMACRFLGARPNLISTFRHDAPTGVDDDMIMVLDYGDQKAILHSSFRVKLENNLQIFGEKGMIEVPLFWKSSECFIKVDDEVVEHFHDDRESLGYNFETEAVCDDLLNARTQSNIMPLTTSMDLQRLMQKVLSRS